MNIKAFFVDALTSALDLSIGTPEDLVRHVTPDVLAACLPRPLWARLFTACLGAARVDATLVVETIGIPNLCEHVPSPIIWSCIAEIGARSLGKTPDITVPAPRTRAAPVTGRHAVLAPPPEERAAPAAPQPATSSAPVAIGPSIPAPTATPAVNQPLADLITELENDSSLAEPRLAKLRPRSPTAERFRQSNTGLQRIGANRRPQASAAVPATVPPSGPSARRGETEGDLDTHVGDRDKGEIAVDDSQLVDWQATDGSGAPAMPHDEDFSDIGRKR